MPTLYTFDGLPAQSDLHTTLRITLHTDVPSGAKVTFSDGGAGGQWPNGPAVDLIDGATIDYAPSAAGTVLMSGSNDVGGEDPLSQTLQVYADATGYAASADVGQVGQPLAIELTPIPGGTRFRTGTYFTLSAAPDGQMQYSVTVEDDLSAGVSADYVPASPGQKIIGIGNFLPLANGSLQGDGQFIVVVDGT